MTDKIPDDVMKTALDIVGIIREHKNCEEEYNTFQIGYREAIDIVARALLSEREAATKAERERNEKLTSELAIWVYGAVACKDWHWDGDQKFAAMECLVSAHGAGYLSQYPMEAIAAAIRKGEEE